MKLTDTQVNYYVSQVLKLRPGKRQEYLKQVDFLITRLDAKIKEGGGYQVTGLKKTGSLIKGTGLRPQGDNGVDADLAVYLNVAESDRADVAKLHQIILRLVRAIYPQKQASDFEVQPRTLGIHFRDSELDVDLVPVIPIACQPGYGCHPQSGQGGPVKPRAAGQLACPSTRAATEPSYPPHVPRPRYV